MTAWGADFVAALSDPDLFYLLFMVGLIGLGYELTHPGLLFPGVAGAICLALALVATSVLPVSFGAAALILLGVAMLVAEAFVPSFGALGIGGMIALVLGSVFLVDPTDAYGLRISWYAIAPGVVTVGAAFVALGIVVLRSRNAPVRSGREGLIGSHGVALADCGAGEEGQVRLGGGIWTAVTREALRKGDKIEVTRVDGLTLGVAKASPLSAKS